MDCIADPTRRQESNDTPLTKPTPLNSKVGTMRVFSICSECQKIPQQLEAVLLALLRMKLRAEDRPIMQRDRRGEAAAIVGSAGLVPRVLQVHPVAVDDIE